MANTIILKKSSTAAKVPLASDLQIGELAVNLADQKLYSKNAGGTVILVGQGASASGDVVGPSSATDNAIARFDTTTGKLIQNSVVTVDDSGNIAGILSEQYNTVTTPPTIVEGLEAWDSGNGSLELGLKGGNVSYKYGQQEFVRAYNGSGSSMTKGQIVYIVGAQGNRVDVRLAKADAESTSAGTIGFVAESIANGAEGWVQVSGTIPKLDTSTLTAGQTLYLSAATAGAYTTTRPTAPNHTVILGWVERVSSTVGSVYIKVDNGYELDELHNVLITSVASGNTLIYDASVGVWKNANISAGTGISVTNGAGSITIANTGVTSVTGTSPVVSSGGTTPAISLASGYGDTQNPYASKTANYILAAPNGASGVPTFRAIVAADIPTLNQNTTGTASNITAYTINQNLGTANTPSFDQVFSTNNGNGTNFKVGDDAWIGDVNTANTIRITGQQDATQGYIIFGNSNTTALGRTGTGNLTYGGSKVLTGTAAVSDGGTGSTSLTANNVLLGNGTSALQVVAPGTSGNVLTSNGTTWVSQAASGGGATITDDTTTNATYYPLVATATSGSLTAAKVSSTKYTYNPSTGTLTSTTVTASSDERLKSNWASVCDDFLEQLSKVKHGTYDHIDSNVRQVGASAQGIQSFLPEGTDRDANGMLSLNYGGVALVAAIKLSERLLAAESRIEQLEQLLKAK